MKSLLKIVTVIFLFVLVSISCRKDLNNNSSRFQGQTPDLVTKISSSVKGFVTDENNLPVAGASVKAGTIATTTDNYGYFELKNAMLVREAAVVTVEYAGYFKGIKTYFAEESKTAFFRIKLLPKSIAGTIQASSGGSVTLTSGLSIALPADAVKTVSTGAAYSGTVNIAMQWIDPTSAELNNIMPGDLRGINTDGFIKGLATYGMAAVELTGSAGELLQIADGKKATLTIPLPTSIASTATSSIPLWYFDESAGLWKEEGQASKTVNSYVGQVAHFSFWNCDVPNNYIHFNCTVVDDNNNPASFSVVKISELSNPNTFTWGYTDSAGYVAGFVPGNTALKLEILSNCSLPAYSQNFNTTTVDYSAGTIIIHHDNSSLAEVSGTVLDCNNNPVTNGFIIMKLNNDFTRYYLNSQGSYNFSLFICSSPSSVNIFGLDMTALHASTGVDYALTIGSNNIPNIQVCGAIPNIYDGKYKLSGYHNRDPYTFPYADVPMEMITTGSNDIAFYWPEMMDFGHPIGSGPNNQLTWYGNTVSPVISFDPNTNEIINVYNSSISGPLISVYTGSSPVIHNYYDPAARKIYVAWEYNNNTLRAFFDTLTYTGPR